MLIVNIFVMQNLLCVKEIATPNRFGGVEFLGFEKLTFFPIQVSVCFYRAHLLFIIWMNNPFFHLNDFHQLNIYMKWTSCDGIVHFAE